MARIMRIELEHYEKIEGQALELDGKANKLSQMIRANLPAAMQGSSSVPLFAGYDLRRKQGRMWKFDVTGGRYEEAEFEATGSGGLYARESLKKSHHARASKREALQMAVQALTDAADEDRGTGRHRHRARDLPDRHLLLGARASSRRPPPRSAKSTNRSSRAARTVATETEPRREHAVLRLARTGDAGQGGVRPQGHRPRQVEHHARVRGRNRADGREHVHAVEDRRDLRPDRVRRASASSASSTSCGRSACAMRT
jgi:hypothetical protein